MRKLLRSIAKARMIELGFTWIAKKTRIKGQKGDSRFARQWRKWCYKETRVRPLSSFGMSKKRNNFWEYRPQPCGALSKRRYKRTDGRIWQEQNAAA